MTNTTATNTTATNTTGAIDTTSRPGNGDHCLLADIGGTSVRFALCRKGDDGGTLERVRVLRTGDHGDIVAAARAYLGEVGRPETLRYGAFDIACAVQGDLVQMTNAAWRFSTEQVREELGLERLLVVNDFVAIAYALPQLPGRDVIQIGGAKPVRQAAMALLGPGTGLGTSGLIPAGDAWAVLEAEGGHVTMAPADDRESEILALLRRRFGHVSGERVVSGQGLTNLYAAIAELEGAAAGTLEPADITARWAERSCPLCVEAVNTFCAMLGTLAGNIALTLGAHGGVYIGGGIVPRLGEAFAASRFRERFESKGRFRDYLAPIPVYVITTEHPAFLGLKYLLDRRIAGAAVHAAPPPS